MTAVLDAPVPTNGSRESLHAEGQATDVVTFLNRFFSIAHTGCNGHTDRLQILPLFPVGKIIRHMDVSVAASFFSAVSLFAHRVLTNVRASKVVFHELIDVIDDCLVQVALVALECQDIVRLSLDDLLGDFFLRPHRINRNDGPRDVDQSQKFGNRCDFIRLFLASHLPQRQAIFTCPHADRMQSSQVLLAIMTAACCFSVDGKNGLIDFRLERRLLSQGSEPRHETTLKGLGAKQAEHAPKDILPRNSMRKVEQWKQERRFVLCPVSDRRRTTRPRQHGHHRNHHDTHERMLLVDRATRIFQFVKVSYNFIQRDFYRRHGSLRAPSIRNATKQITLQSTLAQGYLSCQFIPECALALFRTVFVFDVSQTEGEALPEFARAHGEPGELISHMESVIRSRGISLVYESLSGGANGASQGGTIVVRPDLSPAETFRVLAHETAHEMLHQGERRKETSKTIRELEAEAVAFIVSLNFGIDSMTRSSDYIQLYSGDKEMLIESLEHIQMTATTIIQELLMQKKEVADALAP